MRYRGELGLGLMEDPGSLRKQHSSLFSPGCATGTPKGAPAGLSLDLTADLSGDRSLVGGIPLPQFSGAGLPQPSPLSEEAWEERLRSDWRNAPGKARDDPKWCQKSPARLLR